MSRFNELEDQIVDLEIKILQETATLEELRSYLLLKEEMHKTPEYQELCHKAKREVESLLGRPLKVPALPEPLTPEMINELLGKYSKELAELE